MSARTTAVIFGTLVVLLLGDAELALAEVAGDGGRPMLLAEAGRRRRRRRRAKQPPPPPTEGEDVAEGPGEDEGGEPAEAPAEEDAPGAAPEADRGDSLGGGDEEGGVEDNPFGEGGDEAGGGEERVTGGGALRRSDRLEFDERLIKGQSARSGAIYLFKRTPRRLPELVTLRTTYRSRIVNPILGPDTLAREGSATKAAAPAPSAPEGGEPATKAPPTKSGEEEPAVEASKADETPTKRRRRRPRRRRRRR